MVQHNSLFGLCQFSRSTVAADESFVHRLAAALDLKLLPRCRLLCPASRQAQERAGRREGTVPSGASPGS